MSKAVDELARHLKNAIKEINVIEPSEKSVLAVHVDLHLLSEDRYEITSQVMEEAFKDFDCKVLLLPYEEDTQFRFDLISKKELRRILNIKINTEKNDE